MAEGVCSNLAEGVLLFLTRMVKKEEVVNEEEGVNEEEEWSKFVSTKNKHLLAELHERVQSIQDTISIAESKPSPLNCLWLRKIEDALGQADQLFDEMTFVKLCIDHNFKLPKRNNFDKLSLSLQKMHVYPDCFDGNVRNLVQIIQLLKDTERVGQSLDLNIQLEATLPVEFTDYLQDVSNGENCWSLFKSIAIGAHMSDEQQQIGKLIVAKCNNVPFLVKVVASLLRDRNLVDWYDFADDRHDIIDVCDLYERDCLLKAFRYSYNQLEPAFKHCLAYCSVFPKAYEFNRISLIRQWVAQGFTPLFEDGAKIFNVLHDMFFFQGLKCDALGCMVTCKMNPVVHYLSSRLGGCRTAATTANSSYDDLERKWYMSVSMCSEDRFPRVAFHALNLRTLMVFGKPQSRANVDRMTCCMLLSNFKVVRVLDLHNCGIDLLPTQVGDLVHLTYLDLSHNGLLVSLPTSITNLHKLQVLMLNCCGQLKSLPEGIGKLIMLRSLQIDECSNLTYMPLGLEKLTRLESLSRFVVCKKPFSNHNVNGGIRALGTLNSLQGKLKIEFSGEWTTFIHEAPLANLKAKSQLTHLEIEWVIGQDNNHSSYYYGALLEAFQPPSSLKVLCIEGYKGKDFPNWSMMEKLGVLPNLMMVSISGCSKCKHLPLFGQLEWLKILTLRYMEEVEYIEDGPFDLSSSSSTCFFPSLEELTLRGFKDLKGWWKEIRELDVPPYFPKLLKVTIWNCPKMSFMPLFPSIEEVEFQNVDSELLDESKFQHVPNLKSLVIKRCANMKFFPSLGVECRNSIKSIVIDKCHSLTSLNREFEGLISLEELEISHCKELALKHIPGSSLNSLSYVLFQGIPKMESLPEGLQMIKTLKSLSIVNCNSFKELPAWLSEIHSLKVLKIEACHRVTSLPASMQNLNLEKLEVIRCPELIESCRQPHGRSWPFIKHIPVFLKLDPFRLE